MQVCMACHTTADETGRFCPACGAVLAAGPLSQPHAIGTSAEGSNGHQRIVASGSDTNHGRDHGNDSTVDSSAGISKSAASLVGLTIDGFSIDGVIGGGAFGTVYRGHQLGLDRAVAIKVPTHEIAADPVMAKRFAREAKSASRVVHPGVVAIHGVGELPDGRPYLAMQMVEGESLDKILLGGPLPPRRALTIARQIASALSETHAADVVHRDLKPSNIVWRRDRNGDDRITIVDFGIAVCKPGSADATRLTAGGLLGTPHYMSPEQAHGEMVDARADLYALGCILFELLTGATPYSGSAFEVLLAHLGRPAPLPSERIPTIPPAVDVLVGKLMAKRPADRIPTADATLALIDEVLDELDAPVGTKRPRNSSKVRAPVVSDVLPSGRAKRKTAAPTVRDRPAVRALDLASIPTAPFDPEFAQPTASPPPAKPYRWMAAGAAATLALCALTLLVLRLVGSSAIAGPSVPEREPVTRRDIVLEDGDMRVHVGVPDPLVADEKRMQRLRLELRTKLGAAVAPETLVVTVQDPQGKATGIVARPRQENPEQLSFGYRFATAGKHVIRIFPPDSASTFDVEIDVR